MAPMVAWGYSFNLELHERWLQSLTGTAVNSIVLDDNRPGISSWIPSLLMERPMMFSMRRNFVSLDPAIVQVITNSVRVLFVLAGILLISRPLKRPAGKIPAFYDLAVICLLTPLVFPHQGKYALLYTLPAYAICISYLLKMPAPVHRGPAAAVTLNERLDYFGTNINIAARLEKFSQAASAKRWMFLPLGRQ